jgi:hypothetical protein
MDGYGIQVDTPSRGSSRYRRGEEDRWDLAEAEALAMNLLLSRRVNYVTVGNGDHEFRRWSSSVTDFGNFNHPDLRWAEWYVDVEINGNRWRYHPLADLDDYEAADDLAVQAVELAPDVTRIWLGRSDGSEEHVSAVED